MARLGKRERAMVASAHDAQRSAIARNVAALPALAEVGRLSPRLNRAYNPRTEALTASGRGRVMYNAQGSDARRKGSRDETLFDSIQLAKGRRTPGLG